MTMQITAAAERPATQSEIRAEYNRRGHEVRISRDGHVTYKSISISGPWLDGRFADEYRYSSEYGVRA
jgi:hypothetical protein